MIKQKMVKMKSREALFKILIQWFKKVLRINIIKVNQCNINLKA